MVILRIFPAILSFRFKLTVLSRILRKQIKTLQEERDSMVIEEEESLKNYYNLILQYKSLKKDIREIVFSPKYYLPFLLPNRAVCLDCTNDDEEAQSFSIEDQDTWGVLMKFNKVKSLPDDDNRRPDDANYTIDVLTRCLVEEMAQGHLRSVLSPLWSLYLYLR